MSASDRFGWQEGDTTVTLVPGVSELPDDVLVPPAPTPKKTPKKTDK